MPLKRWVTIVAPASAAAQAPSKSTVLCPSATTTPRSRKAVMRAQTGVGFGRERDQRDQVAEPVAECEQPVEVDGPEQLGRMGTGRTAEERTLEMDAEHDARARGTHRGEPVERAGVGVQRCAADRRQACRCTRPRRAGRPRRRSRRPSPTRSRPLRCRSPGCRRNRGRAARHRDRGPRRAPVPSPWRRCARRPSPARPERPMHHRRP